jgi:HEAT repeat protein
MNTQLLWWLFGAAAAALFTTLLLVCVKLIHRLYLRWQGVRTAQYIGVLGELISRELLPVHPPQDWAHDALFHDALVEYRLMLVGSERGFVDRLVGHLGVLDVLRERIRHRFSASRRLRSVATFVDLATPACTEDLRALLADRNLHIAIHAAKGLSRLRDVSSVPAILDRSVDAPPWHAARLADSLAEFGPEVGPPTRAWIEHAIANDDPPVQTVALAVRVLGLVADVEAEPLLLRLLNSDLPEWRVVAATALGRAGGHDAVVGLVAAIDDNDGAVRARSAVALGQLGDPTAAAHLRPVLKDPVWWVRQNAAEAIGELRGGTSVLVDALSDEDPYAVEAALYVLTMNGAIASAAQRSRQGNPSVVDIDLLAFVGNLPSANRLAPAISDAVEPVAP